MLRDASKHASPNTGWPEAAMAGALDVSLGGPRSYGGQTTDLPFMGDGEQDVRVSHIGGALRLYAWMLWGHVGLLVIFCFL